MKDPDFQRIRDPAALRRMMHNAKLQNRDDYYWKVFEHLCEIEGSRAESAIERDFHAVLTAYEELLSVKNKRRTSATRTRQKLARKGLIACLEDWALASTETPGFRLLVENGKPKLTGEYLVLNTLMNFLRKQWRRRRGDSRPLEFICHQNIKHGPARLTSKLNAP